MSATQDPEEGEAAVFEEVLTRRELLRLGYRVGLGASGLPLLIWSDSARPGLAAADTGEPLHEARYYEQLGEKTVRCEMCFRRCLVREGRRGFCRNKVNHNGRYYSLVYGKPCAIQIDPVEKEPSFHMIPGMRIFCVATASCNNRCKFCHNWHISQKSVEQTANFNRTPQEIVDEARALRCQGVSFTYSEPTVFYEYMFDIAKLAKESGLKVLFHTNGGMNTQPLLALLKHTDAVTVDLKAFTEEFYREVSSSRLGPVLNTLRNIKGTSVHLEVVNLVIPTLNDDMGDIRRMCAWIRENLGRDTPVHFNRFSPAHRLRRLAGTPVGTLEQARGIATREGLKYVYIGNVPGHKYNSTFCPACGERLIHRSHFEVLSNHVSDGKCGMCGEAIPGVWS